MTDLLNTEARHMIGKFFRRWGLLTGVAGPVLLFQASGCSLAPGIFRDAVLQVITQAVAFGLDNAIVSLR